MKDNSKNIKTEQKQARAERLAQALKDNLRRRKTQARKLDKNDKNNV